MPVKLVEWHCGIGGLSAALGQSAHAIAAIDIKREAIDIYARNFPNHRPIVKNIESITDREVASWGTADLWWMSPPCQPHTVLGNKRDLKDPRSASFARMLELIKTFQPDNLAMENVPGFGSSLSRQELLKVLDGCGYQWYEETICPTQWAWPNRRQRYYLAATRQNQNGLREPIQMKERSLHLFDLIRSGDDDRKELNVSPDFLTRYQGAIHIADRNDNHCVTNCFTSAYGRSPTRCGSYLKTDRSGSGSVRRFSPSEILALLDFPSSFQINEELPLKSLWPMVGNSLTLNAIRRVISRLPL